MDNSKYIIRNATIWDARGIVAMWARMQEEIAIPQRYADKTQQERFYVSLMVKIYKKDHCILVAEDDKKLIGFIMGYVHYFEYGISDLIGNCDHVWVHPNYRGGNIMKDLVKQLVVFGKKLGIKSCEFITVYDEKLVKAWSNRGFKPTQIIYSKEV